MKYAYGKKATVGFFLTLLLASTFSFEISTAFADFQRTKIAVLDFELIGDKQETSGMGAIVSEWFTTGIVKYGRFDVVERAMLQKIVTEQKLSATGMIDETSAATLGKILGVKVIISGSIVKLRDSIEINSRVINVENGSIIAAESSRGSANTELHALVDELLAKIIGNFPLTGYVVKRNPKSVIIDLGLNSGLATGTEFFIYKEGEVIKHPKTGEILDVEQIITGRLIVTKVSQSIAEGEIQSEEAGGIQYGQLVKSVQKEASKAPGKKQEKTVEKPIVKNTPAIQESAPVADTMQKQEKAINKQAVKETPTSPKDTPTPEVPLPPAGKIQEKSKPPKNEASASLASQSAPAHTKSPQKASSPQKSPEPALSPANVPPVVPRTAEQPPALSSQSAQAAPQEKSPQANRMAIFPFETIGDARPYSGVLAEKIFYRIGENPGITLAKSYYKLKGIDLITDVNGKDLYTFSSFDQSFLTKKGLELGINLAILGRMNIRCKDSSQGTNNCDIKNMEVLIVNLTTGKVYTQTVTGTRSTEDAMDEVCKAVFSKFTADRPK